MEKQITFTLEHGWYHYDGTQWAVLRHTPVPGGLGISTVVARFHNRDQAVAYMATLQA